MVSAKEKTIQRKPLAKALLKCTGHKQPLGLMRLADWSPIGARSPNQKSPLCVVNNSDRARLGHPRSGRILPVLLNS